MAKSNVPNYVQQALSADRTQQVNTLSAIIVFLFGEQKANREVSELGAKLHREAPHKSEKTWQNYVSAASAVVEKQTVKLEAIWAAAADPAEAVAPLVSYLTHELKARKYQCSMEDVSNWARGKPSMAAKKKADEAAAAAAALAQKKADEQANAAQKLQAQQEAEAAAAAAALKASQKDAQADETGNGDEQGTSQTGYPPAIEQPAPVFMMNAVRNPAGDIVITLAENLTRADLVAIALQLEMMLETAPAPVAELVPA